MKAEIDLNNKGIYVVQDGTLTRINPLEHGTDQIIWKDGQVLDIKRETRIRLRGQEEI